MRRFLERLLNLLRVRRPDHDLAREIDAHLALLQDAYEARGLSPDAARRAARLALGNVDHVKAQHRDARSFRWIEDAWQDAAHGLRLLRRSPVFTATAALSLAIGIGANTAIFTVANALLFRPPAGITDPSELVVIGTARGDGGVNPLNHALYLEIARRTTSLTSVFAEEMFPHVMGMAPSGTEIAEPVLGRYVTREFLQRARRKSRLVGACSPMATRPRPSSTTTTGSDGSTATMRLSARCCGSTGGPSPSSASLPQTSRAPASRSAMCGSPSGPATRQPGAVMAGGRVRPDVSFDTAVAELTTIGQAINRDRGAAVDQARTLSALPFSRAGENRNIVRGFAAALMVLVSLVLAVACANVAGIMLTRATARAREIALRAALGAGRGRLARQLLTETIVLFLFSGLLGIGLARVLTHVAMLMLPPLPTSIVVPLTMDWRVLLLRAVAVDQRGRRIWCAPGLERLERGAGLIAQGRRAVIVRSLPPPERLRRRTDRVQRPARRARRVVRSRLAPCRRSGSGFRFTRR